MCKPKNTIIIIVVIVMRNVLWIYYGVVDLLWGRCENWY